MRGQSCTHERSRCSCWFPFSPSVWHRVLVRRSRRQLVRPQQLEQLQRGHHDGRRPDRWLLDRHACGCGDAPWRRSGTGLARAVEPPAARPVVGMAATPDGNGYWLVASDGGIFNYGDATFYGSTGAMHLNKPIVGMTATPDGKGYWLVASDGGIFSYGDAQFYGSTGSIHLNKPIVGMAATTDGKGYWLVASDGGIFNYGDAGFYGSTGAIHLNMPIVGMAPTPDGNGYWLVAFDGGVFTFGDAGYYGSTAGRSDVRLRPDRQPGLAGLFRGDLRRQRDQLRPADADCQHSVGRAGRDHHDDRFVGHDHDDLRDVVLAERSAAGSLRRLGQPVRRWPRSPGRRGPRRPSPPTTCPATAVGGHGRRRREPQLAAEPGSGSGYTLSLGVPIIPTDSSGIAVGTLAQGATGAFNSYYVTLAQTLVSRRSGQCLPAPRLGVRRLMDGLGRHDARRRSQLRRVLPADRDRHAVRARRAVPFRVEPRCRGLHAVGLLGRRGLPRQRLCGRHRPRCLRPVLGDAADTGQRLVLDHAAHPHGGAAVRLVERQAPRLPRVGRDHSERRPRAR